ncbi:MAG: TlpA disulfide reductase family protein [Tropicimonas sp.]|uniref:TlpA disulfide reductase family protein n=1 Tax=Tropicimonas sp. TaxID=2067044 RepID=UPI003A8B8CA2
MTKLLVALVYTGLALLANPVAGFAADFASLAALREGDMKKLVLHESPKEVATETLVDMSDQPRRLSDHAGKWLVVNFWATWCAPCRKEMPTLSALQTAMEAAPVEVITVATGPNPVPAIRKFIDEIGAENLPLYRDPKQKLAREMAVLGLPVTVILDPQGREVARLIGDADWDSDSAVAILEAMSATK